MLFEQFPTLPFAAIVAAFVWAATIGVVAYLLVFRTRLFNALLKVPMVPPFIALPGVMFTFLMAFMASDAWNNISQARTSLMNEVAAVNRIAAVPLKPETTRQQAREAMRQYIDAATEEEFKQHFNQRGSPKADAAIVRLEAIGWTSNAQDSLAAGSFLKALDDLRVARHQRLGLGFQGTLVLKWVLVLSLAQITAISIAAVHRGGERTAVTALALFCLAAWMAFSMVASHIQPYRGPDALTAAPLQALRASL
jgi:hypothetical protein